MSRYSTSARYFGPTQVAPLRRGGFHQRDFELTIASSFLRISIDDFHLEHALALALRTGARMSPLGQKLR